MVGANQLPVLAMDCTTTLLLLLLLGTVAGRGEVATWTMKVIRGLFPSTLLLVARGMETESGSRLAFTTPSPAKEGGAAAALRRRRRRLMVWRKQGPVRAPWDGSGPCRLKLQ